MEEAILKMRPNKVPQNIREITGNCETFVNEMACRRFATSSGGTTTNVKRTLKDMIKMNVAYLSKRVFLCKGQGLRKVHSKGG